MLANAMHGASFFLVRGFSAFAAAAVYSRELGVEGRGRVAFGLAATGVTALIFSVPSTTAMIQRAGRTGDVPRLRTALAAGAICCVPAISALALLGALEIGAFRSLDRSELAVVMVAVVPTALYLMASQAFIVGDRLAHVSLSTVAGALTSLLLVVGMAALGDPSPAQILAALMSSWAVGLVWLLVASDGGLDGRASWADVRQLLGRAGGATFAALLILMVWRLDVALVATAVGFRSSGLYAAATSIAEISLLSLMAVRPALQSRYASSEADHDELVARVTRLGLAVGAIGAMALTVLGPTILRLAMGNEFVPATPALRVLAFGVPLLALQFVLFDRLTAAGASPRWLVTVSLAALAVVLVGDLVVLPGRSPLVASAVSTTAYGVLFVGFLVGVCRASTLSLRAHLVPTRGDARLITRSAGRLVPGGGKGR